MKLYYQKVKSFVIKRRTFEGKTNPAKNDNSLTSKYMPSYRYWLRILFYDGSSSETCYRQKIDCSGAVATAKAMAGRAL